MAKLALYDRKRVSSSINIKELKIWTQFLYTCQFLNKISKIKIKLNAHVSLKFGRSSSYITNQWFVQCTMESRSENRANILHLMMKTVEMVQETRHP